VDADEAARDAAGDVGGAGQGPESVESDMGGESSMEAMGLRSEAGAGTGIGGDGEIADGTDTGAAAERGNVGDDYGDRVDRVDGEGESNAEGDGEERVAEPDEPDEPGELGEPTESQEVTDQALIATPGSPATPSTPAPPPGPPASWASPQWAFPQPPASPAKPRMPRRDKFAATAALGVGIALAAASLVAASGSAAKPKPPTAAQLQDETARAAWRTMPIDVLFPPTLDRPGGEQYFRLGLADPAGCDVLPAAFVAELAKTAPGTTCDRVLRATYADSTQTVVATVGVVVVGGTPAQRDQVWRGWTPDSDSHNADLMPGVFAVPDSVAAKFTDAQRVSWNSQTSSDGSFLVYAVSGFLDGRAGSKPADLKSGVTKVLAGDSPPVQAAVDLPPQIVDLLARAGKKA
jgi:hypothetical protein